MTDLSPRETAARALARAAQGNTSPWGFQRQPEAQVGADAVLAAVAAHDGLAEVLRAHQERETTVRDRRPILLCECGHELHFSAEAEAAHLADVVRAWMVQT